MNGYNWQDGRPHSNSNSPAPLNFQSIQHLYPEHFKNNSLDQLNPRTNASKQVHSDNNSYDNIPSLKSSDESIPLSLTAQDLTLQESKTYMRWYSDILARTNSRTVTINDIYTFLNNFKIPQNAKEKINKIFFKILSSINIGEFFALLRVISHVLLGEEPSRSLVKVQASIPCPPSILSKKRQKEEEEELEQDTNDQQPLDIDSFTQFLLTGERPSSNKRSKKLKSVKFSDQVDVHDDNGISPAESPLPVEQQQMDYLLPMDQLLERMKKPDEEEKEVLKDMESQMNHFQHLNTVDTMSVGGTPFLQPNMTGPAQMARIFSPSPEPLRPNITGPADMARMFSPPSTQSDNNSNNGNTFSNGTDNNGHPLISLSAFSSQMTGPTMQNTIQNSNLAPAPPPPRQRSLSSPLPNKPAPPPPPPRRNRAPLQQVVPPLHTQYPQQQPQQQQQQYPVDPNIPPPLPPKIAVNDVYSNNNDSTANILDDLKALQEEVDKIRDLTGGF